MAESFSRTLRFSPLAPLYEWFTVARWKMRGRPIPPPYTVKRLMIQEFARRFECPVLVETGTYRGDTIWSLRKHFDTLYSIELFEPLYKAAVERFAGMGHVKLLQGDSGDRLKDITRELDRRAIFWLDGHYSGEGTGLGVEEAPVMREMQTIFDHAIKNHIILLDDAREFTGRAGYPKIEELRSWVTSRRPDWIVEVAHDVVRVYPKSARPA